MLLARVLTRSATLRWTSPQGKHGRFCSDRCRMDGYVLRRAKAMIAEVGIIQFNEMLESFEAWRTLRPARTPDVGAALAD